MIELDGTYLKNEMVIDVRLCNIGIKICTFDKPEEKLVDDLDMRPCDFENRLVFFRVKGITLWVDWGRKRPKEILGEHIDDTRIHGLRDDVAVVSNIVKQLMKG